MAHNAIKEDSFGEKETYFIKNARGAMVLFLDISLLLILLHSSIHTKNYIKFSHHFSELSKEFYRHFDHTQKIFYMSRLFSVIVNIKQPTGHICQFKDKL
ncbi:hypothetical protein SUGI_0261150 [Cryptomeria japonica]|nr:hypothetical protein SUGI_0261150 [Cryptomeria japonica]